MSVIRKLTEFNGMMFNTLVGEGMIAIDCTVGNGHDSELLLNQVGSSGMLYGFDIQNQAISRTDERLKSSGFTNYKLYHASHDSLEDYFDSESVNCIVYNLGYLPNSDKQVATKSEPTLVSLLQGLEILKVGGFMSVTVYPGHKDGKLEKFELSKFMQELDSRKFHVLKCHYDNQQSDAPFVYWVQKK